MVGVYPRLLFLRLSIVLMALSLASSYCPKNRIHSIGLCALRMVCIGTVRDVSLPDECRGSVNHPVTVDLILHDAIERFDDHVDKEFLSAVTTFKAIAVWPETRLSFLKYMPKLKNLILSNNRIQKIAIASKSPFHTLKHLQRLDLSGNNLTDIENLFMFEGEENKLKTLILANNDLNDIPGDAFSELTSLKELDLSHNQISDLTDEPFNNLVSLETLRLNNNKIANLNGALNNLTHCLKHLYLRGNQIQNIDERSLKVIHHLETLDISGNQLDILKPIIFLRHWQHFGGVCKIILSENQLTSIPNGTSKEITKRFTREHKNKVDILTEIDLSKNRICNIEHNAFQSIEKLTNLDLSNNLLTIFLVNPKDLKDVQFLNLSSNLITNLYYDSFSFMINLQNLDLSNNSLSYIPDETFTNNYNLKSLNMTYNEMNILERLHIRMFHIDGGVLDLSHNGLSRLIIPYGEALRLTVLVLNSNEIMDASKIDLFYQNELKMLEMRNNHIQKLNTTTLRFPLNLKYLDLCGNDIDEIAPSAFHDVRHLESLYLGHNKLKEIQYGAFQGLTDLSNLDLSFNNIHYLDSKVLMDLKSLSVLSLRSNDLYLLDYKAWLDHKYDLRVYLDENSFTCEWLSEALTDYSKGYSKMRPTVRLFKKASTENSIEGIPCVQGNRESEKLLSVTASDNVLVDERLLMINKKILEAIHEQTYYLKSFMRQFNYDTSRFKITNNNSVK